MKQRKVEPEILDRLAPGDPEAVRSRRELRLINRLMGNWRWLSGELAGELRPGVEVLEIGAGDARMAQEHLPAEVNYHGIDRAARPAGLPDGWGWERRDVLEGELSGDLLVANLFLHHLSDEELGRLGSLIPATVVALFFCEPFRHSVHLWQGRLLHPFGLSRVTQHDMRVSIAAGFRAGELGRLLGLDGGDWDIVESRSFFGALRFRAVRKRREHG